MAQHFELVLWTASLSKYVVPLLEQLDPNGYFTASFYREHCVYIDKKYAKDLQSMGRNLKDVIIIDNSPTGYMFQPECGLPIVSWYDDRNDRALLDYIPMLIEIS